MAQEAERFAKRLLGCDDFNLFPTDARKLYGPFNINNKLSLWPAVSRRSHAPRGVLPQPQEFMSGFNCLCGQLGSIAENRSTYGGVIIGDVGYH